MGMRFFLGGGGWRWQLEAQVDALATKNRQNQWIIRELLAKVKAYEISINR